MDLSTSALFITGGAGTLGRAIARRRKEEGWKGKLTVYSTDTHKHDYMRRFYPDVNYIQGDIRDDVTLYMAMVGHDTVIHAGAVKVIPVSEFQSIDTISVNITGSLNVAKVAQRAGVSHVLGISTDKACHAANSYGATKYEMEKIWQEFARMGTGPEYHLVRYGNVLESTGSVVEAWKKSAARGEPIKMTDPAMTRFWLSPRQAVEYVVQSLDFESGCIYIPRMPALSIGDLAAYTVGDCEIERVPLRPGEKIHETLLTCEEGWYAHENGSSYLLRPTTSPRNHTPIAPYMSNMARQLSLEQLTDLLND